MGKPPTMTAKGARDTNVYTLSFAPNLRFPPRDPETHVLILADQGEGVAALCERVCQQQDALRDEGEPDIRIEIQITKPQLKILQQDDLFIESEGQPLAYDYPGVPHKTKLYFYGVLMRVIRTRAEELKAMRVSSQELVQ